MQGRTLTHAQHSLALCSSCVNCLDLHCRHTIRSHRKLAECMASQVVISPHLMQACGRLVLWGSSLGWPCFSQSETLQRPLGTLLLRYPRRSQRWFLPLGATHELPAQVRPSSCSSNWLSGHLAWLGGDSHLSVARESSKPALNCADVWLLMWQKPEAVAQPEQKESLLSLLLNNVLKNPYIWGMALTYFFIYVVRQGVTSWFVFYLIKV